MKINVFCCNYDIKLHKTFAKISKINVINLRSLNGNDYLDNSVILISEHSTNKRLIQYIRQFNVLTPIYIVSNKQIFYGGINGCIQFNSLNYLQLKQKLSFFPQRNIWSYVFQLDYVNRKKLLKMA